MASMMLGDPQLIVIDEISNHLNFGSVEALIYGLKAWNDTVVLASHDANLIHSMGGDCFVLFDGKLQLQRVGGGIDSYLALFMKYHYMGIESNY
jgi:ATPase subunit of ABC transporter with duplicated ATPase domains